MIKRFSTYINESNDIRNDKPTSTPPTLNEINEIVCGDSKPKKYMYCNICNQKLFSIDEYNTHLQTKKHLKRIKRVAFEEINSAGSIKQYLIKKMMIQGLKRSPVSRAKYELYSHLLKRIFKKMINK